MKILVTGGAGFIGSHLVEKLLEMGHEVVTLDNLLTGRKSYLLSILNHPRHTFVHGSVTDRDLLNNLMDDCNAVFHLAAVLGVKNTIDSPLKVIEGNIDGTRNVLEIAFQNRIKVIFASTSEVYGKNNNLPFKEDSDRVLGATTTNRWSYATAKALDEHLCFAYAQKGLPVTVIRFFNAYGPRATSTQYGGVVPKFISAALQGEPITIYGDGEQTRCFTYIEDAINGSIRCMSQEQNNKVFNIGIDEEISINYLAERIKELSNSTSPLIYIPYDKAYGEGYEDTPKRVPDLTFSNKQLNYFPSVTIDEGLRKTISWYEGQIWKESDTK